MSMNLRAPELRELKPRIMVCGVGGAGGNAVNNMIVSGLIGVDFIVANTDAQALTGSKAERIVQMGLQVTEGLGAGSQPEVGRAAAEEAMQEIRDHLSGAHMVFVTAGMGGGTGTGAAPVIARVAREMGILTVGVVTKPFQFEGQRRMRVAEAGIGELQKAVDTLIVIPNQNLFRVANEKTTFADAFSMADQVLYSGVACITDLMVKEGLINLDFADVRAIMREMGKAMMGTGEASGDKRAILAAEAAIANPLLDETSMKGAKGLLISITGGNDLTLYEVDEAASRIRQEVDEDANIILGATFDEKLDGIIRVSVVATGIDRPAGMKDLGVTEQRIQEAANRLRAQMQPRPADNAARMQQPVDGQPAYAPSPAQVQPAPVAPAPVQSAQAPVAPQPVMQQPVMPQAQAFDVDLRPVAQAPAPAYDEPARAPQHVAAEAPQAPYIPPAPEQVMRPVRVPTAAELPLTAQRQIEQANQPQGTTPVEARRKTLFDRLANWGMASRQEETAPQPRMAPQAQPQPQAVRPPAPMAPAPASEFAPRRPAARPQAQLDPHGRVAPARPSEEDQLEIPAFLRRQSS